MSERGNILFLILLAVVLFVALTYAVNSGMRGGGNSGSKESTDAMASELINNGALLKAATDRLRMVNGCKDTEVSTCTGTQYHAGNCLPKTECRLFHINGGNLTSIRLPNKNLSAFTTNGGSVGTNGVSYWVADGWHSIPDVGTNTEPELMIFIPDIRKDVCDAINRAAGISSMPGSIMSSTPWWMNWNGIYGYNGTSAFTAFPSQYAGREFGCFYTNNDGWYNFYQVLIPR